MDSEKTVTRPLLSKEEAQALLDGIEEVPGMELPGDRQKEACYKCALRSVTAGPGSVCSRLFL